ncbi:MAG: NUDIX domain-containing protein, partial [Halobacteriales archaeon]|nr:NUDIX domain-containing protein [Halobacteriales archaeon]
TCFLRHRGEVLLCRRADDASTYPGRWAAVSGYVEEADPEASARREISEETGIVDPTLVRVGEPFSVEDPDIATQWTVHPFLFEAPDRTLELTPEHASCEWASPTAILDRETVPDLWRSYERVAPTVETVRTDRTHGAAGISVRALEVLRDGAAVVRSKDLPFEEVTDLAKRLVDARPSMVVLLNRVNRVMVGASTASDVLEAAMAGIERACEVDQEAASATIDLLSGARILTLSRSGTVLAALQQGAPDLVIVAESRPAREGTRVAELLAERGAPVAVCTDAAVAHVLVEHDVDVVLVGADAIGPNGTVVNKTGTRGAALAADYAGIPVHVVAATDKVSPVSNLSLEEGNPTAVYDGPAPVEVLNPTFDLTPPDLVSTVITERGPMDPKAIDTVAAEHAARRNW